MRSFICLAQASGNSSSRDRPALPKPEKPSSATRAICGFCFGVGRRFVEKVFDVVTADIKFNYIGTVQDLWD